MKERLAKDRRWSPVLFQNSVAIASTVCYNDKKETKDKTMKENKKNTLLWTANLLAWLVLAVMNIIQQNSLARITVYLLLAAVSLCALISSIKAGKRNK